MNRLLSFPSALLLLFFGCLVFLPGIGDFPLFDWDEVNFAECAREMLLSGNWRQPQINFEPFYEKPPLFLWMQALSMQYFGISEWAARFPNVMAGLCTILAVYFSGKRYAGAEMGILWALFFGCSLLPQIYFKSGIIDPWFNLFIFLSLVFFFDLAQNRDFESRKAGSRTRFFQLLLSGVFCGLAMLTKGPVALLLLMLTFCAVFISKKGKNFPGPSFGLLWIFFSILTAALWIGSDLWKSDDGFMKAFIDYQIRLFSTRDAGHGGPWFYHPLVLLLGCFPASALAFGALASDTGDEHELSEFRRWMIALLSVVLIVFSVVQTKIIHYSSLAWFPLTFLSAVWSHRLLNRRTQWTWKQGLPVLLIGTLWALAAVILVVAMREAGEWIPLLKDPFAREAAQAKVFWSTAEVAYGLLFLPVLFGSVLLIRSGFSGTGLGLLLLGSVCFGQTLYRQLGFRIERYSQGAYTDFLKSVASDSVTIEVAEFKSYAHLFYGKRPTGRSDDFRNRDYVMHRPVPFKVYLVTKEGKEEKARAWYPHIQELYRKNGWIFYKKENN